MNWLEWLTSATQIGVVVSLLYLLWEIVWTLVEIERWR